jgi:hypothetical protein
MHPLELADRPLGAVDLRGAVGYSAAGQFTRLGLEGALRRYKVELHAASRLSERVWER